MPYFKDSNNNVHFLDNIECANLLPVGCVEITIAEANDLVNPPETQDQIISRITRAVEDHMDFVAHTKGYDDRKTCALRAGYIGPWQDEGIAFGAWMDACWVYCYQVQDDVLSSIRQLPTEAELIAELPVMIWP